jgi:hypothetical protein
MISLRSSRAGLATAFGVHRALDTARAMLGPLIAFGILLVEPSQFRSVFVVSFCFAMLGSSSRCCSLGLRSSPWCSQFPWSA